MDYVKTLKLQFRVGDLDLPERRKRYTISQEEEDDKCAFVAKQKRLELTLWENVKRARRSGMCCRGDEANRRM